MLYVSPGRKSRRSPPTVKVSVQAVIAGPLLVIRTSAVKPFDQVLAV